MGMNISNFVAGVFQQYPKTDAGLINDAKREKSDFMGNTSWDVRYSNDLFVRADANKDNKLAPDELKAFVSKFDTNHNGQLDNRGWLARVLHLGGPSELEKFQAQYHEETVPGSENSY